MIMMRSICGLNCEKCGYKKTCAGCGATGGRPFRGECVLAVCCRSKGYACCGECTDTSCTLKQRLIREFNALGIADMEKVTELNALWGALINLEYTLPGGQKMKIWDDNRVYLGNQLCKKGSDRCYGIAADEHYLMVSEYGDAGSDAELIVLKRWN